MNAKRIKNLLTVVLTTSMVVGSTVTAFADAGVSEGAGSYEGGEMKYPTLSVTLPTIPEGTYNYIADPNGLIAATSNERYSGATFTGTAGIFFQTEANKYTNKSAAQTVTNENAVDIDVTVKLEEKTPGSDIIKYSATDTFEAADKENKLYLAVTDGAETTPAFSALSSAAAATLTTKVAGKKDNYEPSYTSQTGYVYKLKDGTLTWNSCSYNLVGALNTGAEWGDSVDFPAIKVTWSYAEHSDDAAPSIASTSATQSAKGQDVTFTVNLGGGDLAATGLSGITFVKNGETRTLDTSYYTFAEGTLTFKATQVDALTAAREYTVKFNDTANSSIKVTVTPAS